MPPHLLIVSDDSKERNTANKDSYNGAETLPVVELGVFDLFRHSGCRRVTLIMFVNWIAVTLGKIIL